MSKYLGFRQAFGALSNDGTNPYGDGRWAVTFDPKIIAVATDEFEIYHLALKGPTGSQVQVYLDRTFYDITLHGDINSWDPNRVLPMKGGQTLYLYWNIATTPAPQVTIWLQRTSPF